MSKAGEEVVSAWEKRLNHPVPNKKHEIIPHGAEGAGAETKAAPAEARPLGVWSRRDRRRDCLRDSVRIVTARPPGPAAVLHDPLATDAPRHPLRGKGMLESEACVLLCPSAI